MSENVGGAYIVVGADASDWGRDAQRQLNPQVQRLAENTGNTFTQRFSERMPRIASGFKKISTPVANTFRTIGNTASDAMRTSLTIGAAATGVAVGAILQQTISRGFGRVVAIDTAEARLRGLGMTGEEVAGIMGQVDDAVTGTAFGLDEAANAAALMSTSGVAAGKDMDSALNAIVVTAAAGGTSLDEMTQIWQKMAATGRVSSMEIFQLSTRGVNALAALADYYGVTQDAAQQMVTEGKVSFEDFNAAMSGSLGDMADEMGQSFEGMRANVGAAFGRLGAVVLDPLVEGMKPVMGAFIDQMRLVTPAFEEALAPALPAIENFFNRIAEAIAGVDVPAMFDSISNAVDRFSGLIAPLAGLAIGALGPFLSRLPIVGRLFMGLTGPVGLLIGLFVMMWRESATLRDAVSNIFDEFGPVAEGLGPVLEVLGELVTELAGLFGDLLGEALNMIVPLAADFGTLMIDVLSGILDWVQRFRDGWVDSADQVEGTGLAGFFERIGIAAGGAAGEGSGLGDIFDSLVSIFSDIASILPPLISSGLQVLSTTLGWIADNMHIVGPLLGVMVAGFIAWQGASAMLRFSLLKIQAAQLAMAPVYLANNILRANSIRLERQHAIATGQATVADYKKVGVLRLKSTATAQATVAQRGMNTAMRANPIGIIITLIAALVAGLVWFFTKTEIGQKIIEKVWGAIKKAFEVAWNFIKSNVLDPFMDAWDSLTGFFGDAGEGISDAWNGIKDGLAAGWNFISDNVFGPLKDGWDGVKNFFSERAESIKGAFGSLRDNMSERWTSIKTGVMDKFSETWGNVTNFFETDTGFIGTTFRNLRDRFKPIWDWINNNIFAAFRDAWELVRSIFSGDTDRIRDAFDRLKTRLVIIYTDIRRRVFTAFRNVVASFKTFFDNRMTDLRNIWEAIKTPFRAVYNWVNDNVFKPFRKRLDWLGDRVKDARDRIGRLWDSVKAKFRSPINWVIRWVWNRGIVAAWNKVAKILPGVNEMSEAAELPAARAKGGPVRPGQPYLVGEEGPELITPTRAGWVHTAPRTSRMLNAHAGAAQRNVTPGPIGGDNIFSRAWRSVTGAVASGVQWIRGGLARAAEALLNPIKGILRRNVGGGTFGDIAVGASSKAIDSVIDWIRGKDEVPPEGGDEHGGPPPGRGAWRRPSFGPITSRYGPRWGAFHAGIDIAGGGPTFAAAAGSVLRTGWNTLAGRTGIGIILSHGGGVYTYYGHNPPGGVAVRAGQQVSAGQRIGRQGATGNVTGVHLHFELHRGGLGRTVNPETLGVFDNGGIFRAGMLAANLSNKPEAILTDSQWTSLSRLASQGIMGHMVSHKAMSLPQYARQSPTPFGGPQRDLRGLEITGEMEIAGNGIVRIVRGEIKREVYASVRDGRTE